MSQRKLSDILIEIATQGLKSPKYAHSEVMHPLMILASIAWNRDTQSPDYQEDYQDGLKQFSLTRKKMRKELISEDWEIILQRFLAYKQTTFPDDRRIIVTCAYTPWETLRVEWKDGLAQSKKQKQSRGLLRFFKRA